MTQATINQEIKTLEEVLNDDNTSQEEKELLQPALSTLYEKRRSLEKEDGGGAKGDSGKAQGEKSAPGKKAEPEKKILKSEVYEFLKKEYPELTQSSLPTDTKKFSDLKKEMVEKVKSLGPVKAPSSVVGYWLHKLPKGTSTPEPEKKEPAAAEKPESKNATAADPEVEFDWKKPISQEEFDKLKPYSLVCDYRVMKVEKPMKVDIKNTARKGDFAVFNGQRHLVMLLTAERPKKG